MSISESVTIILPLPRGILSPNRPPASFGGRMGKARAASRYRRLACKTARESGVTSGPWEDAIADVVFYHAQKRRRDSDNYQGMLKPAYDGLRDAGLLVDDDSKHLERKEPRFELDRGAPRVEITLLRRA